MHFAASAKASSMVQPLLMMTPDHDPEVFTLSCPANARLKAKRNATEIIQESFVMSCSVCCEPRTPARGCIGCLHTIPHANNTTLILPEYICLRVTRLFPSQKVFFG